MDLTGLIARTGELLIEAGWTKTEGMFITVDSEKAPVYEKTFETAVGPKTAFALARGSADREAFWFEGTYFSEGSNVIAACSAYCLITDVTLKHVTAEFALRDCVEKAEQAIDRSYARRLFLEHGIKSS